jgi:hypothetical protein
VWSIRITKERLYSPEKYRKSIKKLDKDIEQLENGDREHHKLN